MKINRTAHHAILFFLLFICGSSLIAQGSYQVSENQLDDDVELLGPLGDRLIYTDIIDNDLFVWSSDGTEEGTYQLEHLGRELVRVVSKQAEVFYFIERDGSNYHLTSLSMDSDTLISIYDLPSDRIERAVYWNDYIYMAVESATVFGGDDLVKLDPETGTNELLFTSDFGGIRGLGGTDTDLFFIASMDEGKILGKTDGTLANTMTVQTLYPDGSEFGTDVFMESDGEKIFFAYHPNNEPFNLWVSDGTPNGTEMLETYDHPSFGTPDQPFTFFNGKFFYVLQEEGTPSGTTFELHVSDGTVNGTFNLNPSSSGYLHPRRLTVFNNKVYFTSLDNNWKLMSTDGTLAGTETVITPYGHQNGSIGSVYDMGTYKDSLVLHARNAENGTELFISDGTLEGTSLLSDIAPGPDNGNPLQMTQVGDLLFFVAGFSDKTLWVFDPSLTITSIDETLVENFKAYPNPSYGEDVTVELKAMRSVEKIDLSVFDLSGKLLFQKKEMMLDRNELNYQIPHAIFSQGLNIIDISTNNRSIVTERIKVSKN